MLGEHATKEAVAKLRDHLGPDKPLLARYSDYVGRVRAATSAARSSRTGRSPTSWPTPGRPPSQLTVAALVMSTVAGIAAGVISAVWPNSSFDALARLGSLFGLSMPIFWTGLVLIVVFSLWLRWLPVGGMGSLAPSHPAGVHAGAAAVAMVSRMTRSAVLDVLREDHARTARAKGLAERLVVGDDTPCATPSIPILTLLGLQSGQLMGGAVLTETVFAWPASAA